MSRSSVSSVVGPPQRPLRKSSIIPAMASGTAHFRPAGLPAGTVSWLEIDEAALRTNVRAFLGRLSRGTKLMAVVKADAYGHGMSVVVPPALEAGASWLGVWGLGEGIALRGLAGAATPILLLGHTPPADFEEALAHDLRLTIYDPAVIDALAAAARSAGRPARVHLKVETGTNRQGLDPRQVTELARRVAGARGLVLEGLSTHFADIEDTTDHTFADGQRAAFAATAAALERQSLLPPIRHTACSAAAILFPETHFEMARVGISLYGLWPSRETLVSARERGININGFALAPVMTWKCLVAQVKDVAVGGFVGYGRTWRAMRPTRIALLPVGYYEGYPRSLSGRAHVLLHGQRAPVLGRICMNMMMVDVTDIDGVKAGDAAVLLGRSGDECVRAEDLATWAGTIHYEVTSRIHPSLPRIPV